VDQPIKGQHIFGNIVTTVSASILKEIARKGSRARFQKTGRGRFARR